VSGGAIQVDVVCLDIFSVISLTIFEPDQAFLQNGIFAIPKCEGKQSNCLSS
jgi:hypothetical protein